MKPGTRHTDREYYNLYYKAETGPDSWQYAGETIEEAREKLTIERARMSRPQPMRLDPSRLVIAKVTTVTTIEEVES